MSKTQDASEALMNRPGFRLRFVLSHPFANCAKGWGTRFRADRGEKQILRCAQDDTVAEARLSCESCTLSAVLALQLVARELDAVEAAEQRYGDCFRLEEL